MKLFSEIEAKIDEFEFICSSHKVRELYAFGSAITKSFNPEKSDYDFLVYIDEDEPLQKGELLLSLWDLLESFFNRRIDLLTEPSIKNPYLKKSINETRVLIYDGKNKKVLV